MTLDQLELEALKLPAEQRTRLLHRLILSLEGTTELDEEWLTEARRRDAELDAGEVSGVSWKAVREKGRTRFGG